MIQATQGIVLHTIKYSESGVIVKIYTEAFGIQSYLVKGIGGRRPKHKPALLQPLTLLDMVVYHKERQSLQSVKELQLALPYRSIPFDIRKSSVALFINELVYRTIREEEPNPTLFRFLWNCCVRLDETEGTVAVYPLVFALQLCHFLGIFPQTNYTGQTPVFNLREGQFQRDIPGHPEYLRPEAGRMFCELIRNCDLENGETVKWQNGEIVTDPALRRQFLEVILAYYRLHLAGFRGLQSHHILHDVLAE